MTRLRVSVVVAARDAGATLAECLKSLAGQSVPSDEYEVIVVVDERSTDDTLAIARRAGVRVVTLKPDVGAARFTAGSRNAGMRAALADWVAFTDADCLASRGWLKALLASVRLDEASLLAVAGLTVGHRSDTPSARYVDLTGGLRADRHLSHPRYPWPPAGNVMYRREALLAVGGYDERFVSYEQADLHLRLIRNVGGTTTFAERAVVYHVHRQRWRDFARQQVSYGSGYGQFYLRYRDELRWTLFDESRAWLALVPITLRAVVPAAGDEGVIRRGTLIKKAAQRVGFARTFWNPSEAARWRLARRTPELAAESDA